MTRPHHVACNDFRRRIVPVVCASVQLEMAAAKEAQQRPQLQLLQRFPQLKTPESAVLKPVALQRQRKRRSVLAAAIDGTALRS